MERKRIAIRVVTEEPKISAHQMRNFAEDLFREFRVERIAVVENMDTATDVVWVTVRSAGKVAATEKVVRRILAENLLDDRCEVSTVEIPE